jgi:hypothetical protein
MENREQAIPHNGPEGSSHPESAQVSTGEPGFLEKLTMVFSNPTKLFESLNRKSSWLAPLILIFVVSFLGSVLVQPYVMQSVRDDVMAYLNNTPNIPEQAIQQAEEGFDKAESRGFGDIVQSFFVGALMRVLFFFIVVTVIFLVGVLAFGGTAKYARVMSLYSWALPVWTLGLIIVFPLMIAKGSHSVSLSLALLIPPNPTNPLFFLLHNLSLFNIWAVILLGIGFSVMYGVTRTKGIIAVAAIWVVWIALNSFVPFLNFQAWITGLT